MSKTTAFFSIIGIILLLASRLSLSPLIWLAQMASPDGQISEVFKTVLLRQQYAVAWSMLISGALLLGLRYFPRQLRETVKSIVHGTMTPLLIAAASGLFCLYIQSALFENIPHVTDATCHYFQGKIFASGKLQAAVPPCPDAFYQHNMIMTTGGDWFSRYPPGTALLMAAGWLIGAPELVFPVLHALSVICFYLLSRRFLSKRACVFGATLYASSPMVLLLGASFMSHTPFMLMAMLGLGLFLRPSNSERSLAGCRWMTILAGAMFGSTVLIRPQDTFIIAVCALICLAWAGKRGFYFVIPRLPWVLLGSLAPLGCFAFYNQMIYGSALSAGYGFNHDTALHAGISVSMGLNEHYTLKDAIRNTINILYKFNHALLGWPISLFFIPVALVRAQNKLLVWASLSCMVFIGLFFFFYSYPAYEYEARFWILMTPFCIALTAMTIDGLFSNAKMHTLTAALLLTSFFYALLQYWPRHIWPTYGNRYEEVSQAYYAAANEMIESNPGKNLLIMVKPLYDDDFSYSAGFIFNEPDLSGPFVFTRYDEEFSDCLLKAFPDRWPVKLIAVDEQSKLIWEEISPRSP